jgi:hypothetical protein
MDTITKQALIRAVRAFIAGAVSTMIAVPVIGITGDWKSLANWCLLLAFAGIVGGISGVLQGIDKYIRG